MPQDYTSTQVASNEEEFQKLDAHARSQYGRYFETAIPGAPRRGPVEVDYWSISYKLVFPENSVFVKIPKVDRYQADVASAVKDPRALESARIEFDGFEQLHRIGNWPAGCATVRPLEYVASFNSILTEYVPSEDLFRQCRRAAIPGVGQPAGAGHLSLRRCGAWLRHFQRAHEDGARRPFDSDPLLADIHTWAAEIRDLCVRPGMVDSVLDRLQRNPWSREMAAARTCEGFEVRNIIVDAGGAIRLVDPGRLSLSSGLEDVAHFLASLTMLYWGTPALWLGIPLSRPYRQAFLDGWTQQDNPAEPAVIAWFETWEWFRQWLEAYRVLAQKPYSATVRRLLRAGYVDAFFLNRIAEASARACPKG